MLNYFNSSFSLVPCHVGLFFILIFFFFFRVTPRSVQGLLLFCTWNPSWQHGGPYGVLGIKIKHAPPPLSICQKSFHLTAAFHPFPFCCSNAGKRMAEKFAAQPDHQALTPLTLVLFHVHDRACWASPEDCTPGRRPHTSSSCTAHEQSHYKGAVLTNSWPWCSKDHILSCSVRDARQQNQKLC